MDTARYSGPVVHSAVEASLYLLVTPCPNCGRGPVRADAAGALAVDLETRGFKLAGVCTSCRTSWNARFRLAGEVPISPVISAELPGPINRTNHASSVIDVAQWLTLFRMLTTEGAEGVDRVRGRELKVLAGRCVEEALKFYGDPDSDLPPATGFFHPQTRQVFQQNPQAFARRRLLALRAKLPSPIERA